MANYNFNKVILGGRLTATPELKQTLGGVMVTQFTVAVNRKYAEEGKERQADFIRVTAWRQTAEFVCRYFSKGSSICVVGSIQTRSYTDQQGKKQYSTEVVADEVNFVDSKGEGGSSVPPPSDADAPRERGSGGGTSTPVGTDVLGGPIPQFETISGDDELPF